MHPGVIITTSLAAVIGLAIVAVLVSRQAQTSNVIGQTGGALAGVILAAVSPVTGQMPSTANFTTTGGGGWSTNSTGNLLNV